MENSPIEIVDLRHLRPEALQPLLAEEARAWLDNLHWDYSATSGMILRFIESRALTGYAAMSGGRAVGFAFYVCEAGKGLVGDVFVCRDHGYEHGRVQGPAHGPNHIHDEIIGLLLTHTLETLEATPGVRRIEAQLLHVDTAAVRALFRERSYACYERSFLKLPLPATPETASSGTSGGTSAGTAAGANIVIAEWEAGKLLESADLITRSYAGHVDCEVSDQYRTQAGAQRFLDNIIHYTGCGEFYPPASLLAYADAASDAGGSARSAAESPSGSPDGPPVGSPVGMLLTSIISSGVAHITQLCVSPERQGTGVGRGLLRRALDALAARGFHTVTLTVTNANGPGMSLYRGAGFTILQRFPAFAWEAGKASA